MSDNPIKSTTCKELLKKVDKEKSEIIDKIDLFYENNKSNENLRRLLYSEFNDEINNFCVKYKKRILIIADTQTDIIPKFNFDCSDKITERVTYLENYIDNIAPLD